MTEHASVIEGWGILELMGHRRLGGYLSEVTVAGVAMVRIDVPHPQHVGEMVATQLYSGQAIYGITPTTEEIARAIAQGAPQPVSRWDLRALEAPRETASDVVDAACGGDVELDFDDCPI
ncbi:MAG: hypothetical protein KC442_03590 [Thermomicrobiales bacterium]|nr:hypothetical protein [Thermomicrobiales bacterium]